MTTLQCPKCSANMDHGFVIDDTYGAIGQSNWTEGEPKKSFWTGIKVPREARHPIVTYRCTKCGYLESYAPIG